MAAAADAAAAIGLNGRRRCRRIGLPLRHLFTENDVSDAVDQEAKSDEYESKDEHKQATDVIEKGVPIRLMLVADVEADETQPND